MEKKNGSMEDEKELNSEELEKVSGGGGIVVEDWQGGGSYE